MPSSYLWNLPIDTLYSQIDILEYMVDKHVLDGTARPFWQECALERRLLDLRVVLADRMGNHTLSLR